jgi:hydrogenase expression/formation protein HypE
MSGCRCPPGETYLEADIETRVLLAHGSGGKLSHELIDTVFRPAFANAMLDRGDDSAVMELAQVALLAGMAPGAAGLRLAMTTDTYVVKPMFFPGGDIGRLAVCGTVNDLCMVGARPLYLSAGFVLEEGLETRVLRQIVASMAATAREAGVVIVTGDTKVVERGSADGLFINTAGVGLVPPGLHIGGANARPGDAVIVSGTMGDHGIAVMSQREGLAFRTTVRSDVAPLNGLVAALLATGGGAEAAAPQPVHVLRDPTRGGLATTLNEIARQSGVCIRLDEQAIPIRTQVRAACEMLGYDPLYVANEGKLIAVVSAAQAEELVATLRRTLYGEDACIVGQVGAEPPGRVLLKTRIGGTRIVDMLAGEMLPRIC